MEPPSPSDAALEELAKVLGPAMAGEVVRVFLSQFPATLHELGRGDRERSRRAAHGLKSSARQMGALGLSRHMAALEEKLGRPEGKITAEDLTVAVSEFAATAPALRAFVAKPRG
jgi:HPt (histidine-containing phosphotransfer) domain-containing protein